MDTLLCPRCQSLQAMEVTRSERHERNEDDHSFKISTKSYHCKKCHAFVQSDDIILPMDVADSSDDPLDNE